MGVVHFRECACVVIAALIGAVGLHPLSAHNQDCPPNDLSAALQPGDQAYAPALTLSQDLQRSGFVVRCVLRSHFESAFEGQIGAALYRTDRGDFEALFLAPPATFDQLTFNERREGASWVYTLTGQPKLRSSNRIEGRRLRVVKHAQRLFMVLENDRLAATLERVIAAR